MLNYGNPRKIDLFSGETHSEDSNELSLPPLKETATEIELLDYMVFGFITFHELQLCI